MLICPIGSVNVTLLEELVGWEISLEPSWGSLLSDHQCPGQVAGAAYRWLQAAPSLGSQHHWPKGVGTCCPSTRSTALMSLPN